MTNYGFRTKLNGQVHYDSRATNLGKYIATIDTNLTNGSWTNAALGTGQVEYQVYPVLTADTRFFSDSLSVSVSGNTISWTYPASMDGYQAYNFYIVVWIV